MECWDHQKRVPRQTTVTRQEPYQRQKCGGIAAQNHPARLTCHNHPPRDRRSAITEKTREQRIDEYVQAEQKNPTVAFLAALLLGPLGYLYTNTTSGVVAILLAIAAATVFWPFVMLV